MLRADLGSAFRFPGWIVRSTVLASLVTTIALFGLVPAEASRDHVTRGEAQAVLNAFGNAGWAILNHHGVDLTDMLAGLGAPADSEVRAAIRPFSGSLWDGRHFCAGDWHVILVAAISTNFGDPWSLQQARAELDPTVLEFTLDGSPLATSRTAIKRFLRFADQEAYYFQQGAILAPNALAIGSHTVSFVLTTPIETSTDGITFHIDPPGEGACI